MAEVSIEKLAADIGTSVDRLVKQFKDADIVKAANENVTEDEKRQLLDYLSKQHGGTGSEAPKRMTLQRKTTSTLNMGKSKAVTVEVRKKRTYVKRTDVEEARLAEEETARALAEQQAQLEAEKAAEEEAKKAAEEKAKKAAESKAKAEAERLARAEKAKKEAEARQAEESALSPEEKAEQERARTEAENIRKKQEQEAQRKLEEDAKKAAEEARKLAEENSRRWKEEEERRKKQEAEEVHVHSNRYAQEAEDADDIKIERGGRRRKKSKRNAGSDLKHAFNKPAQPVERIVRLGETISVSDLANKLAIKATEVIKAMMKMGEMATINQVLDQETAVLVVEEMGHKYELVNDNALEDELLADNVTSDLASRAPVVTIMGHVDHGKTSLLDYIRRAKVAAGEAGGITQHIGAYSVETDNGRIAFLDTPGHAAFTAMRARGATATDIVVLVVAADDGVMPQTKEAVQHSKAAGVPLIVAVNKMDKESADPDRVKTELSQLEVISEEWGGEHQFVNVSAKTGLGIDALLEAISLQAELLDLKAPPTGSAKGIVIESRLDKGRGPVASVLVQEGQLKAGDILLCGIEYGRVRAMRDENGQNVAIAGPSTPVEVLGLSGVPVAGEDALVVQDERKAREVATKRNAKQREIKLAKQQKAKLENMFANMEAGDVSELNIVLKADVQGSVEAISDSLTKLSTSEVKVNIVGSGVGGITETDASLAAASSAIVVGFNVRADASARRIIESEEIDLRYYSVIYSLIDEVKMAMTGMLAPEFKQEIIGLAEVRDVFKSPKLGAIAGCMVVEGTIKRSNPIRVLRENVVIYEGELESLRRFKDDVQEVRNGVECGIGVKNYNDVKVGDQIEVFEIVQVEREL
ncbi:translation initiation factor IF-2 [Paraglaciecola chathamensis]|jgi:translation initiation factor IF-2|uniref:Translation initiation factor IF-2 n=3 Tax=Paraglaciecola chathamensis TaxID=368405 RepID=A0A8H9I9H9_9ALTE|nr:MULTISPECIES: translation initiation factor IF-2 [Paraglaciecola]AEE23576.1 translation initiation factor IF-2 [Glaciecola sp. 4H-3-7+YE-5]MBJ2136205.1 translation initiation factor IF-2 [Paraglaciecola chathamensis]MBU3016479.1 translation initiation factor IF-2 [Paraglaciecola agarilytica]MDO6559789.1 translation initiation factor IF-2 [Paraglaciecola chathamensis]MDO6838326.1 translation initiation factor IF-2 [Paraglaciecola chathamensis]|tara:strand:+ start:1450 stop:4059 length:2610 start_codon:yes stop_codon:yes gene_type:complete